MFLKCENRNLNEYLVWRDGESYRDGVSLLAETGEKALLMFGELVEEAEDPDEAMVCHVRCVRAVRRAMPRVKM